MDENEKTNFMANYLTETWSELVEYLLQHPEKLAASQFNYWQSYLNLYNEFSNHSHLSNEMKTALDKRFQHEDWQNNLI